MEWTDLGDKRTGQRQGKSWARGHREEKACSCRLGEEVKGAAREYICLQIESTPVRYILTHVYA